MMINLTCVIFLKGHVPPYRSQKSLSILITLSINITFFHFTFNLKAILSPVLKVLLFTI